MRTTILLVGHGSRVESGNRQIEKFAQVWRSQRPDLHIELCFLEFAPISLQMGLTNDNNGDRVIVVPLILNAAGHVKSEIPLAIEKARKRKPNTEYIYARHLGAGEKILTILTRNLRSLMMSLDMPDPKTTGVILLGRGSSDRFANGENAKLARYLFEENEHELVDAAFTGICYPRLETSVQRQIKLGMKQIIVLPYYLFTGTLMERIEKQVTRLQSQYPQVSFALGENFGFENEIYELLDERLLEATDESKPIMMECDGCEYRTGSNSKEHTHDHQPHSHHHTPEKALT